MASGTERPRASGFGPRVWLRGPVVALAALVAVPTAARGDADRVVVTAAKGGRRVSGRKLALIDRAARSAAGGARSRTACGSDPTCLQQAGSAAGAGRAVGIAVRAARRDLAITLVVVEVATGNELGRDTIAVSRRELKKLPGPALRRLLAVARRDSGRPPLAAAPAGSVTGDGRSSVAIEVKGGPRPGGGERRDAPAVPVLDCADTASWAPSARRGGAVIGPAVSETMTLHCTAELRGERTRFDVAVDPPGPGVYARLDRPRFRARDRVATLSAFAIDDAGARIDPGWMRAAASVGQASVDGGKISIALPRDKAPRTIAVALADGSRIGAAFVPVHGATRLPVEARAERVSVRIAGREFGPVEVRHRRAEVPIEVPPGVRWGVIRAFDQREHAVERRIDLGVPDRRRVAAVAPRDTLGAGDEVTIVVAAAGTDGRPAAMTSPIFVIAERGATRDPVAIAPGLWTFVYRAPAIAGTDRVRVRVDGDDGAGRTQVPFRIVPDAVARVDLRVPSRTFVPGDQVEAAARVVDSHGNDLPHRTLTATLDGQPVDVMQNGHGVKIHLTIPDRLPRSGQIPLRVTSGGVSATRMVRARSLSPATAVIRSRWHRSSLAVSLDVRDRFGNQVDPDAYSLRVTGGSLGPLERDPDGARAALVAADGHDTALIELRRGVAPLTRAALAFAPGPGDRILTGHAAVATSALQVPRFGVGVGLTWRRRSVDWTLQLGGERAFDGAGDIDATSYSAVVGGRTRLRLGGRFGLSLAAAGIVGRTTSDGDASETTLGARGTAAADVQLGLGLLQLGAAYGHVGADLPMTRNIDGAALVLGYEWWFISL